MVAPHSAPFMSDSYELTQEKKRLRADCLRAMKARTPAQDDALCQRLSAVLLASHGATVACVWPLPHEADIRPVCHALSNAGRCVVLPDTPPRGHALTFRVWTPDTPLLPGRFGTFVPDGPERKPQLILVPLVGYDRQGNRLGYGGGYYDRTLAALPGITAIGYALSLQETEKVPTGTYDKPLSCIVTEKETLYFD
ncbi:5-formyltetrahydrofolate cyclo-ligase [Acetobacter sp. DsW_059]|uniref:5-formyltetrahydrofolate cyclo-ligase n=1 Tax=Acetobacter sp. DsW_059 TaxID=1670661 RepID=UPI000A38001C|nr:5-formyltetrahydrofolate cyclo-ligase [Acetobacter sp. DsW_059]OUJ09522.1 5-formyltetrahydrofolate cyclo-ligase [Acetobacter sp. DsW_059]